MVLALAGLVLGFIGATLHPNRRLIIGLVVAGILLCLVAVALDVNVAIRGLETINLTSCAKRGRELLRPRTLRASWSARASGVIPSFICGYARDAIWRNAPDGEGAFVP
jgi:hypothetical protein